jgi:cathepsin L
MIPVQVLLLNILVVVVCQGAPNYLEWTKIDSRPVAKVEDDSTKFQTLEIEKAWAEFKDDYKRSFTSESEERMRKSIFEDNLKTIAIHNYLHSKGLKSYTMGVNQFADMTSKEFAAMMNGYRRSNKTSRGSKYLSPLTKIQVPDEVDWRKQGYVTGVKNQGQCGSCWSFSTTGSVEGQHFRSTNTLVSLSEQNLVDCSTANHGCDGGNVDLAFQYIIDNSGIDTEASYPYEGKQGSCRYDASNIGATISAFTDVTSGDESALQEAVASVGPVSVAIDASQQSFQLYSSGVYNEPDCTTQLDHAVLVVGYGTLDGTDYWLVKNSWGTTWGVDGYIYMSRNLNNQCGIASAASYPQV